MRMTYSILAGLAEVAVLALGAALMILAAGLLL